MTDLFKELPFDPKDLHAEGAAVIVEAMAAARGKHEPGLDLDPEALVALLRATRHVHRMALSDWLRRNDPAWRVPRARPRGRRIYGADSGAGLEDWDEWWAACWGRARANPGRFLGSPLAKAPLVTVYYLCNEWWRITTGTPFHPNFDGIQPGPDKDNMLAMNPAGRLFLLVAQDCDRRYNSFDCARVHATAYRKLPHRRPPSTD